jgi:putative PIN family toxin of toxin-antitoxin system
VGNGVAHKLLVKLIETNAEIFTTKEILDEFVKVLKRDFQYNDEETNDIIKTVFAFVRLVEPRERVDVIKDDPDDNKILECAVASKSEYVVTYDNHLLSLKEFRGVKIVKPEELG